MGRFGSCNPLRLRRTAFATACDRFFLPNHPLVQSLFKYQQLGTFRFQHPGHRDTSPSAHDLGNFVGAHFLAQQTPTSFSG